MNLNISPLSSKFIKSNAPLKVLLGPVGSGKTTTCLCTILRHCMEQPVFNGVRRARVLVLRNTEAQLKSTVIKSLIALFPTIKMVYGNPITGLLTIKGGDGIIVAIEFIFVAALLEKDKERFLSLEVTLIYLNEGDTMLRSLYSESLDRYGRYPSELNGGVNWFGMIVDSNAMPPNHWMYKDYFNDFETATPEFGDYYENNAMIVIRQPPALFEFDNFAAAKKYSDSLAEFNNSATNNKFTDKFPQHIYKQSTEVTKSIDNYFYVINRNAENIKTLSKEYYTKAIPLKVSKNIKMKRMGHFISYADDDYLCYPMFNPYRHITNAVFNAYDAQMIFLGWDFGLNPSCAICFSIKNKFYVRAEVAMRNIDLSKMIPHTLHKLNQLGIDVKDTISFIDSSGSSRGQADGYQCTTELVNNGFVLGNTVTQNIRSRLNAVRTLLYEEGKFIIHNECSRLIKGFITSYRFTQSTVQINKIIPDKKAEEADIHDALQYVSRGYLDHYNAQIQIPNF